MEQCDPSEFLNLLYEDRMRTNDDKRKVDLTNTLVEVAAVIVIVYSRLGSLQ